MYTFLIGYVATKRGILDDRQVFGSEILTLPNCDFDETSIRLLQIQIKDIYEEYSTVLILSISLMNKVNCDIMNPDVNL